MESPNYKLVCVNKLYQQFHLNQKMMLLLHFYICTKKAISFLIIACIYIYFVISAPTILRLATRFHSSNINDFDPKLFVSNMFCSCPRIERV